MSSRSRLLLLVVLLAVGLAGVAPARAQAATTYAGTLPDGATWQIRVPAAWNGTLLLYSHGYRAPGSPNPAQDVSDPLTGGWLLDHGFALAGSSYASTGWAVKEALADQAAVLDAFEATVGHPRRTIAWGDSLGGIVTAGLVQRIGERLDGALPACGVAAGAVATWNQALDASFAFKVLVAPDSALQLVHITDPTANLAVARQALAAAQATPAGRARIALVAALNDTPGWADPPGPSRPRRLRHPAATPVRQPQRHVPVPVRVPGRAGGQGGRQPVLEPRGRLRPPAPALGQPGPGRGAVPAGWAQPGRRPQYPQPGAAYRPRPDAVGYAIRNIASTAGWAACPCWPCTPPATRWS